MAHWPSGAGPTAHFAPAVQCAMPLGSPLTQTLGCAVFPDLAPQHFQLPMPNTQDSLRLRLAAGERNFENQELDETWYDLQDMNLEGVNFSRTFLVASFRGSNLKGSKFIEANVKTCDFSNTDLRLSNFSGAAIDGAIFTAANLAGASFLGASEQGHVYAAGELPWQN
jgi:hypothetical protein